MNREILFRGKRIDNGEWLEGQYAYLLNMRTEDGGPIKHMILDGTPFGQTVDPTTIGQFTGLTDKNGKRIFEGDIVLKRTYNGKRPFPVDFDGGMFYCGFGGGSSTPTHRYTLEDSRIEVIGNIYDNPELLEGD